MIVTKPIKDDQTGDWVVSMIEDCGTIHPYSFVTEQEADEFVRVQQTRLFDERNYTQGRD